MDRFEEAKLKVKEATDLVELVQSYVALTRRGRNYVACCPFHAEKTPSFTVHPDSQHFKCYGCGKAGDVFTFLMERDGLPFREAMEQLAEQAQVSLEGVFSRGGARSNQPKVDVPAVLGQVVELFRHHLRSPEGTAGREYLDGRGLLGASDDFALGMHPSTPGTLRRFAEARKLPIDVLVQAGLLGKDGRREPFSGRVMFPIHDERGRVVGFGGRVLPSSNPDDSRPKYVNSPESPWFNKRRLLYGLRQVKNAGARRVVIVEGYTDVIACHLAGHNGTAATLGTALTAQHAKLLERYATDGVVLLFDGDNAGRRAADRAFRELVHSPIAVRMALLPEGTDPADLCGSERGRTAPEQTGEPASDSEGSTDTLGEVLERAADALSMWFRLLRDRFDFELDADVERVAGECARVLGEVENPARREKLRQNMARHLGLSERAIQPGRIRSRRPKQKHQEAADGVSSETPPEPPPPSEIEEAPDWESAVPVGSSEPSARPEVVLSPKVRDLDLDVAAAVCACPDLLDHEEFAEIYDGPFAVPGIEDLLKWVDAARFEGRTDLDGISQALFDRTTGEPAMQRMVAGILERARRLRDPEAALGRLAQGRRVHFAREEARQIRLRLQAAKLAGDDSALVDELTQHYTAVLRRSRTVAGSGTQKGETPAFGASEADPRGAPAKSSGPTPSSPKSSSPTRASQSSYE